MVGLFAALNHGIHEAKRARRTRRILAHLPKQRFKDRVDIGLFLQRAVQYVLHGAVEGDFIEFGTATGFTASVIATAIAETRRGADRNLWLFDSFEGLPASTAAADAQSPHVLSGVWGEGTCRGLSAAQLRRRVARIIGSSRLVIGEGWYAETVPAIDPASRFGFVHVDGDLYQSTIDCLTPLFARGQITEGALVVFDDWHCNRASNAYGERKAWAELVERFAIEAEDYGHASWAGKSFVVHGYLGRQANGPASIPGRA